MTDERLARRLTLIWAGVVLVFAVLPTHSVLSQTVGDRETLTTQVGHFAEFAVLAWLAAWWSASRARASVEGGADEGAATTAVRGGPEGATGDARSAFVVWVSVVGYGALIEVAQVPLPYRSAQFSDLAIDAAGAFAGLLLFRCGRDLRKRGGPRRRR